MNLTYSNGILSPNTVWLWISSKILSFRSWIFGILISGFNWTLNSFKLNLVVKRIWIGEFRMKYPLPAFKYFRRPFHVPGAHGSVLHLLISYTLTLRIYVFTSNELVCSTLHTLEYSDFVLYAVNYTSWTIIALLNLLW